MILRSKNRFDIDESMNQWWFIWFELIFMYSMMFQIDAWWIDASNITESELRFYFFSRLSKQPQPATTSHLPRSHLQPLAATCSPLQPLAPQPLAATCSHLQPLAATCSYLQLLAATCSHLQPLAATCSHLQPLASGCKWLLFWKSNCAPPAPTMQYHLMHFNDMLWIVPTEIYTNNPSPRHSISPPHLGP